MDILLLVLRVLLAILLYAFLAAVMAMLWHDLRQATTSREIARQGGRLVVLHATDDALAAGTAFPLQPVTSIGRSPANTVSIPEPHASAQHSLLMLREGKWWLEDRGSRNGTLLNGTRITGPTVVSAGDVIGVGRTELKLELD